MLINIYLKYFMALCKAIKTKFLFRKNYSLKEVILKFKSIWTDILPILLKNWLCPMRMNPGSTCFVDISSSILN